MASAASAASAGPAESDPKATLANLEEQIETISQRIEQNNLMILAEETKIKDILRECGQDEKKKNMKMPELLRLLKEKNRLQTLNDQQEDLQQSLKNMHYKLLKTMWEADKSNSDLRAKLRNVLEERKSAKDKSVSVTAAGPAEGGKRRKTTTRKQKGRRATKKQNKNKKSRKQ